MAVLPTDLKEFAPQTEGESDTLLQGFITEAEKICTRLNGKALTAENDHAVKVAALWLYNHRDFPDEKVDYAVKKHLLMLLGGTRDLASRTILTMPPEEAS